MSPKPEPASVDQALREMDELKGHVAALTDEVLRLRERMDAGDVAAERTRPASPLTFH